MSMIRPEVAGALWRCRELIVGLGIVALGVRASQSFGLMQWLGWGAMAVGAAIMALGWQRFRLRPPVTGPGVIEVDEARITFWGPLDGGSVARDALVSVALDRKSFPAVWVLTHEEGAPLHIPVTAEGQDALIDALSALPGLHLTALTAARRGVNTDKRLLWQAPARG